jgi:hypothetical protein
MRAYMISDSGITVAASPPDPHPAGCIVIQSVKDLDARRFPVTRLVAAINAIPGVEPIKSLKTRKAGIQRLWKALQALPIATSRTDTKQALVVALLNRPEGISIAELAKATGWQPHTVRGLLSGALKKRLGLKIISEKREQGRVYRIDGKR